MLTVWSSTLSKDIIDQKKAATCAILTFSGTVLIELAYNSALGWNIAQGRRACRYSLLVLFLCLHLSFVSTVCTAAFIVRYLRLHSFDAAILYTAQTTQRISHCAAYMILTARAVAVCRSDIASWVLGLTHIALWAILLLSLQAYSPYCMITKPSPHNVCSSTIKATRLMTSVPFLVISIVFSTAVLWGYINERRHDPALTALPFWSRLYRFCEKLCHEGFHYFIVLIAAQVPLLVVDASRVDESGLLRFLMGNVSYLVTVTCASRMFRLLVYRSAECPIQNHCMFYRLFKDCTAPTPKRKPDIPLEAVAHHATGSYPRSGSACPVGRTAAGARTPL